MYLKRKIRKKSNNNTSTTTTAKKVEKKRNLTDRPTGHYPVVVVGYYWVILLQFVAKLFDLI